MPKRRLLMIALASTFLMSAPAFAVDAAKAPDKPGMRQGVVWEKLPPDVQKDIAKEQWDKMGPAERHKFMEKRREAMKKKWQEMTPAEREQFKKDHPKFASRQEKWEKMTPEEREKAKIAAKTKREAARNARKAPKPADIAPPAAGQ